MEILYIIFMAHKVWMQAAWARMTQLYWHESAGQENLLLYICSCLTGSWGLGYLAFAEENGFSPGGPQSVPAFEGYD